jgi:hypothetical protein
MAEWDRMRWDFAEMSAETSDWSLRRVPVLLRDALTCDAFRARPAA